MHELEHNCSPLFYFWVHPGSNANHLYPFVRSQWLVSMCVECFKSRVSEVPFAKISCQDKTVKVSVNYRSVDQMSCEQITLNCAEHSPNFRLLQWCKIRKLNYAATSFTNFDLTVRIFSNSKTGIMKSRLRLPGGLGNAVKRVQCEDCNRAGKTEGTPMRGFSRQSFIHRRPTLFTYFLKSVTQFPNFWTKCV